MKIVIDADACPKNALQYALNAGKRENVEVVTVASFDHIIESDRHIVVGDESQEADIKIANITAAGDVVVTQDWGLAALIISKGAFAMNPVGIEYRPEKMDFMLEEREMKAKFRRGGGRTRGPAKRTAEDDARFAATLEKIIARRNAS